MESQTAASSSTTATAHRPHEVIAIRRSPRGVRPRSPRGVRPRSPRGVASSLAFLRYCIPHRREVIQINDFDLAKRIAQANAPFVGYGGAEGDLFRIRRIF